MNPHDRFFKAVFSQPENAIDHVRRFLPAAVVGVLDVDQATLVPGSYVDEELAELHSDLLFQMPLADGGDAPGSEALVYVLFEHQSTVDPRMPFRLLRYMVRIWDNWLKADPTRDARLPAIIPLVLYHGARSWTAATQLSELLNVSAEQLEALRPHIPDFAMVLNDLSRFSDEELQGNGGAAGGARLLFKHIHDETLDRWMTVIVASTASAGGLKAVALIVNYVMHAAGRSASRRVVSKVKHFLGDQGADMVMTMAEELRAEGRVQGLQQGREEGREEGVRQVFLRLADKKFGPSSQEQQARISGASLSQLEDWIDALLTADSLAEVIGE